MDKEEILEKVLSILSEHEAFYTKDGDYISPDVRASMNTRLRRDLALDSLDVAIISVDVEFAFNVKIDDEKVEDFLTGGDIVEEVFNQLELKK